MPKALSIPPLYELIELYVNQEQTSYQIAEKYNTFPSTVLRWLRKHKIERRKAGHKKGTPAWNKNTVMKEETKEKIATSTKGRIPWNKGKTGVQVAWNKGSTMSDPRVKENVEKSTESIQTQFRKGRKPHNLGKPSPKKGIKRPLQVGRKISEGLKGKRKSRKHRKALSETCIKEGRFRHEKNPNWKGGLSYEKYPEKWLNGIGKTLRAKIRKRDNQTCQICGKTKYELNQALHVHHIDYDKHNLNEDNLISLCKNCHHETNGDRKHWEDFFKEKIRRFSVS